MQAKRSVDVEHAPAPYGEDGKWLLEDADVISSVCATPCRGKIEFVHTSPLVVLKQTAPLACSIIPMSPAVITLRPMRSAGHPASASQRTGPWIQPSIYEPHWPGSNRTVAARCPP